MSRRLGAAAGTVSVLAVLLGGQHGTMRGEAAGAQDGAARGLTQVRPQGGADLRQWDAQVDRLIRSGALELRLDREDTLVQGRRHRRYAQAVNGVPVYGADIVRQTDENDMTVSIFGSVFERVDVATDPVLSVDDARAALARLTGVELAAGREPKLVVLPRAGGTFALAYMARVAAPGDITLYFLDARTGAVIAQRSDAHRQTQATGIGVGVLGDRKKVQTSSQSGTFVSSDRLRPPVIETYDMRGDLTRTIDFLNGFVDLGAADLASDPDNDWTDGANVDAHTYAGYTYDYYFKRFGRRGLDNANIRIRSLTHPVNRRDALTSSNEVLGTFFLNAFYAGDGIMVYGEGLPPPLTSGRRSWNFLAGSLDVVAHELTHGVTDYSSALVYEGESGALNEAFSDIMGTAIEFFFQQPGSGSGRADYLIAEDVVTPGGIRSMENPRAFADPDHYSIRYTGFEDNGGVHINSGIVNQAYYLAVEGGTNRTSGQTVQGVGAVNREQMEKIFYRAFTQLMPASASFSTARAATIQAARDLYGAGSAPERAVAQAWTATGVE